MIKIEYLIFIFFTYGSSFITSKFFYEKLISEELVKLVFSKDKGPAYWLYSNSNGDLATTLDKVFLLLSTIIIILFFLNKIFGCLVLVSSYVSEYKIFSFFNEFNPGDTFVLNSFNLEIKKLISKEEKMKLISDSIQRSLDTKFIKLKEYISDVEIMSLKKSVYLSCTKDIPLSYNVEEFSHVVNKNVQDALLKKNNDLFYSKVSYMNLDIIDYDYVVWFASKTLTIFFYVTFPIICITFIGGLSYLALLSIPGMPAFFSYLSTNGNNQPTLRDEFRNHINNYHHFSSTVSENVVVVSNGVKALEAEVNRVAFDLNIYGMTSAKWLKVVETLVKSDTDKTHQIEILTMRVTEVESILREITQQILSNL